MSLEDKKSYYAIVPANVRYDENLCANSKLLYGEITALCNEKGYCWASNQYFAELYNVSKNSISRWISSLEKSGYIKIEIIYKQDSKEIESRKIWIANPFNLTHSTTPSGNNQKHTEKYIDEIKEIIDYLNVKADCKYRYSTESTNKLIRSKLSCGFTVNDFKQVINNKVTDWKNTEFEKYLRPYTLFGNKFEQYLNQKNYQNVFHSLNPTYQETQHFDENTESADYFTDMNGNIITY